MKLLILGGTRFLGRHLVDAARAGGHQVTLFNRGRTAPDLFPDIERRHGDRDGGLDALGARDWDAVIDTCGYVPRVVRQSVDGLSSRCGRYVFVSSVSVYRDLSQDGLAEDAAVAALEDPDSEDVPAHYGALKAACETVVRDGFGDRALIIRPGLIVGPHDPTERFSYWVRRCAHGGEVLAPDAPDYPVQFIDARDLARWTIEQVERGTAGVFNAVGPRQPLTLHGLLAACAHALATDARPVWVATDFLRRHGVQPWTDLPLWAGDEALGIARICGARALAAGLVHRALADTVRDTWNWLRAAGTAAASGLAPAREAELLAAWRLQRAP